MGNHLLRPAASGAIFVAVGWTQASWAVRTKRIQPESGFDKVLRRKAD